MTHIFKFISYNFMILYIIWYFRKYLFKMHDSVMYFYYASVQCDRQDYKSNIRLHPILILNY